MNTGAGQKISKYLNLRVPNGVNKFLTNFKRPVPCITYRRCVQTSLLALGFFFLWIAVLGFSSSDLKAPPSSLYLLDKRGDFLAEMVPGSGKGYWPARQLPERVVQSTLLMEDRRFWDHPGVDPLALGRALYQNLSSGKRISGASTLAMQVARMQSPRARTYYAKALESSTALFMTLRHGRQNILDHYFRIAPYGNQSHGIRHAARFYFKKPVEDLSWAEVAFLSALPQAPGKRNPLSWSGIAKAKKRARYILATLHDKEVIDSTRYDQALDHLVDIHPEPLVRPVGAMHAILELKNQLAASGSSSHNDPVIETTLDLELQDFVNDWVYKYLEGWQGEGARQAAVIVTERASQKVRAWAGSRNYFSRDAGALDYTHTWRSPGSTLKPFIYALALDRGLIQPGTVLTDLPNVVLGVENSDSDYLGPLLPRVALANSRNVPVVSLLNRVGIDEVYYFLSRLGLHDDTHSAIHYGLSMAVGNLPTTLERLVGAYGTLANDGLHQSLQWYEGQKGLNSSQVISPSVARLVTSFLSDPMARLPTFPRLGSTEYSFPAALKTGTSQGYRDAWTLVYSKKYIVGVWVGRPDWQPMRKLGGARSAGILAHRILGHLHRDVGYGQAKLEFDPPEDFRRHEICAWTGRRGTEACGQRLSEWFPDNQPPAMERIVRIAATEKNVLQLPQRFSNWAKQKQIPFIPSQPEKPLKLVGMGAGEVASVDIISPLDRMHLIINPEMPQSINTLTLKANVIPAESQMVWYVDGEPYQLAENGQTLDWPMEKGVHQFQVRLPYRSEKSNVVSVTIEGL